MINDQQITDDLLPDICPLCSSFGNHQNDESFESHCKTNIHQKNLMTKLILLEKASTEDMSIIDAQDSQELFNDPSVHDRTLKMMSMLEDCYRRIQEWESSSIKLNYLTKLSSESHQELASFLEFLKPSIDGLIMNSIINLQALKSLKSRWISTVGNIVWDSEGEMIWKIDGVREKIRAAISDQQPSIYSPAYYTSKSGYKLCLRLYFNGDGTAKGTHLSIFLVILRGEFDNCLTWPFTYRVSFCLIDQLSIRENRNKSEIRHLIDSFRPDPNSNSFQQPKNAMNIASGLPRFAPLSEFVTPVENNRFIINDTMFIRTFIDFIGISRQMITEMFHLDLAIPLQMRQKLIQQHN